VAVRGDGRRDVRALELELVVRWVKNYKAKKLTELIRAIPNAYDRDRTCRRRNSIVYHRSCD